MKRAPTRDIIMLFVVTRLSLMMVTYFGYILLTASKYSSTPVDTATFLVRESLGCTALSCHRSTWLSKTRRPGFFPIVSSTYNCFLLPIGGWSYLLVGTLLSNGALLAALFVLYQLAIESFGEQVGRRTLLYLCIFPTAFFFFAAYNESLFLLLTTGAFLAMRRQAWWLAGLLGLLAALTRLTGVLLVLPYLYELWLVRENIFRASKTVYWDCFQSHLFH